MRIIVQASVALALGLPLLAGHEEAFAKVVVCISGGEGRYLNNAEGYYRQQFPVPPNIIHVGGNLNDCLQSLAPGDSLIMVTHGDQATFVWNGVRFSGFSGGNGAAGTDWPGFNPHPLPPNFTAEGLNIHVNLVSCFSATDPLGDPISLTSNMQDALSPGAEPVVGCAATSGTHRGQYTLTGGTQAQRDAAQQCLEEFASGLGHSADAAGVRELFAGLPPANSPSVPNAQTYANNVISEDNCPGAGGQVMIIFDYSCAPIDPVALAVSGTCDPSELDVECTAAVPASSPKAMALIASLMVLAGAGVLWRRRTSASAGP